MAFIFSLFLFCFFIQIFFLTIIFSRIILYLPPQRKKNDRPEPVTVLICAHNEYPHLQNLIPCLLKQEYPFFEIIVVNDRSQDPSKEYLDALAKTESKLHPIHIEHTPKGWNNKKYALFRGICVAKTDILLLSDADCMPTGRGWISEMAAQFEPEVEFVLGFSPYEIRKGFLNKMIQFETFMTAFQYLNLALWGLPYMGVGRNMAYRKSLLKKNIPRLRPFIGLNGGDDDLIVNQLANQHNTRIQVSPENLMQSIPKTSWASWFRQKHRHLGIGKSYTLLTKSILALFGLSQILFYLFVLILLIYSIFQQNVEDILFIFVIYCIRLCIFVSNYAITSKKMGLRFQLLQCIFLDFCYTLYLASVGLFALSIQKTKWD